jgi:hypothetical protein
MTRDRSGTDTLRDLRHRLAFLGLIFGALAAYSILV